MSELPEVGDEVIAYAGASQKIRGVLVDYARGRGWGIHKVRYSVRGGDPVEILCTKVEKVEEK